MARTLAALAALALFVTSMACGQTAAILKISHVQKLRDLQNEFNQTATLENQQRLAQTPAAAISAGAQSVATYRSLLASLNELLSASEAQLEADGLLGTAYVLKALTQWRLAEYNAASATIDAVKAKGVTLQPRDKALVESFRGLIMNDQAYEHMQAKSATYAEIKTLLQHSISSFQEGISVLPENHGMRLYLVIAQLGAIKNWVDLSGEPKRFSSDGVSPDTTQETGEICVAFKPVLTAYENQIALAKERDTTAGERLEAQWDRTLHVETISGACP